MDKFTLEITPTSDGKVRIEGTEHYNTRPFRTFDRTVSLDEILDEVGLCLRSLDTVTFFPEGDCHQDCEITK